jgi:alginate O-acetyltransferase complex protein AlgI
MTFNSLQFAAFFIVVLLIYSRLRMNGQNLLIVLAGIIFYGAFDWRFPVILAVSTIVDYSVGRGLGRATKSVHRKLLLAISLVAQLGLLGFFKYYDFFSRTSYDLFHLDFVTLHIILPIGISFYTFQTLGYVITVYRGHMEAEKNFLIFATFVSWFPVLLAGPIGRAPVMLPQFKKRRELPSRAATESALMLIFFGLVKKVVVADALASYVNTVYSGNLAQYGWPSLVLATVAFALEVYGDFSGYSDIARGLSRLLGVEVSRNFEQPFLSRDIREFWTRWHTSMSSWFVDFVGGPLGGANVGKWRALINVMIIMGVIGLWHGPAWHYVIWGLFNGFLIVLWRVFAPGTPRRHPMKLRFREVPGILLTFALFVMGAVFFRATNIHDALIVFKHVLELRPGLWAGSSALLVPILLALALLLDLLDRRARIRTIETVRVRARLGAEATVQEAQYESLIVDIPTAVAGPMLGVLVVSFLVFAGGTPIPFIYFKF